MQFIKDILIQKKKEIKRLKKAGFSDFYKTCKHNTAEQIRNDPDTDSFINNIKKDRLNIIAEIKKASPSLGVINDDLDIRETAAIYGRCRELICGISVLTEKLYFKGNLKNIKIVKSAAAGLPILRKDFIFNELQIYESSPAGADCILLIASILGYKKLKKLYNTAKSMGMDCLVEVHNKEELKKALDLGASLIGINNRNLKNMSIERSNALRMLEYMGKKILKEKIVVIESGINSFEDIKSYFKKGVRAFLVGTYFMRTGSPDNLELILDGLRIKAKESGLI